MYKLDQVTLAPKDKNNKETHIYYLKHSMEQAAILREIIEQAKSLIPLDNASYSACKYVKLIQEFLGYVRDTCPDINKPSEKLVAVTLINKKKIVSSMFDARHELCFLEFVSDMNACSKSKYVKKAKKKKEWKPTGKVFTKIGYNRRPIRRTFILVGNACPLTRITATNEVPLREHIPLEGSNTSVAPFSSSLVDLRNIRTDNGTEFVNQTLCIYYQSVGISHETSVAHTPQQNGVVERRNFPATNAPRAVDLADLPMSTSIDQDAPSTSIPST
ncbi:retrovirus-related pol polyprotein from transposon TNT 1-94 [Tanacetum coccineum]